MTLLARLLRPQALEGPKGPIDDFWYQPLGYGTDSLAGVRVSPATALAISTVYACVRIISQTLAMLPLVVMRRLENGGKERANNHPLYSILHDRPNIRQTSFQFREMLMGHLLLRGNAYAHIVEGPRGFADQLIPLHPDRMVGVGLGPDGSLRYKYRLSDGTERVYLQDEIFHLSTLSDDSLRGISLIGLARNSFGLTLATEEYGARFFSQGARPGGVLKHPGKLGDPALKHLKESWVENYGGLEGSHRPAILEEGMEWQQLGLSNEDSQFLQTRSAQVEEIASWFGVPLSLLQHTEKATSWGTGIAQLTLGFVLYTMQPHFTRWEQEINADLILAKDRYFANFVLEGLLRGDPQTRAAFYNTLITLGILTRNEAREFENLNPLPGLDEPLTPANLMRPKQPSVLETSLANDAAARLIRKEVAAIRKAAMAMAGNDEAWKQWVTRFYEGHRLDAATICKLSPEKALSYSNGQRDELLRTGVAILDLWEQEQAPKLAAMMLRDS